jgi:hypothetical protein
MSTVSLRDWFDMIRAENAMNKLSLPQKPREPCDEADWLRRTREHLQATGQMP